MNFSSCDCDFILSQPALHIPGPLHLGKREIIASDFFELHITKSISYSLLNFISVFWREQRLEWHFTEIAMGSKSDLTDLTSLVSR